MHILFSLPDVSGAVPYDHGHVAELTQRGRDAAHPETGRDGEDDL